MLMVYGLIYLIFVSLPAETAFGGHTVNGKDIHQQSISDSTDQDGLRLMILPIVFRSPDTGFAFGVLPQLIFRTATASNPSTLRMDAYYTQNGQYHIQARSNNWLRNDQIQLTGKASIKKWPTSFYGIGSSISSDLQESFTESLYEAEAGFKRRFKRNYFVGAGGSVRYAKISSVEAGGILAAGSVPGSSDSFISGVDAALAYDTRDNLFFPSSGSYHQLNLFGSSKYLGSDYSFLRATADFRKYLRVFDSQVLAIQAVGTFSNGLVPFRMMPPVGGDLRGYSSARYINKHAVSLQMEYRIVPLFWRLGVVFFAGTGDAFSSFSDIDAGRLKHIAGLGIRYVFFQDEKINIRFDISFGRRSFGDYIDLLEAY